MTHPSHTEGQKEQCACPDGSVVGDVCLSQASCVAGISGYRAGIFSWIFSYVVLLASLVVDLFVWYDPRFVLMNVPGGLPVDALPAVGLPVDALLADGLPAVDLPAVGLPAVDLLAVGLPAVGLLAVGLPAVDLADGLLADGLHVVGFPVDGLPAVGLPVDALLADGLQRRRH